MALKPDAGAALKAGGWKTRPVLRRRKGSQDSNDLQAASGDEGPDPDDGDAEGGADVVGGAGDDAEVRADIADERSGEADDVLDPLPRPPVEQLSDARLLFDCGAWSRDDRAALDAALGAGSIDRVWQGPELVVGLLDEHLVEEAFDDLGVGQAHLAADTDQVVYEVGEWPRVLRDSLAESLLVAGIAAGWDDLADLHVAAADEATVDAILEAMPDPDEVFEEAEGTEVQDLLTQLYAAVDRLKDNPKIPGARLDVVEAADRMDRLAVPFGFDASQWRDLVERAGELRDEIEQMTSADLDGELDDGDGDGDADDADDLERARLEAARASFALRSGQLRDRLVRLV